MNNSPPCPESLAKLPPEQWEAIRRQVEMERCRRSFHYFLETYCWVETKTTTATGSTAEDGAGEWAKFTPWPAQRVVAKDMQAHPLLVILKARQLGLTWLCVAFALWLMLFHPIATVLLFSYREQEAKGILRRLREMHKRLPAWMQQPTKVRDGNRLVDSSKEIEFANGSTAQAIAKAGDSYSASLVIVDEADLIPKLDELLTSLKPTIADGGRMMLVSKSNKSRPTSAFKALYRAAKLKKVNYHPIFLPWHARPGRDASWYAEEQRAAMAARGSLDDFHGNYPATDTEALAPRTEDKRIPAAWVENCWDEGEPVDVLRIPAVPGLAVYRTPEPGRRYVAGADPAMGNPTSDDSAAVWLDEITGEQVAELTGKHEMTTFGGYVGRVCEWFNCAPVMVEENNHGHTVLKHLRENHPRVRRLIGHLGREGWCSSPKGKVMLYDGAAEAFRAGDTLVRSFEAMTQIVSIDGNTLLAPDGQPDDIADAYALALAGRLRAKPIEARASRTAAVGVVDRIPRGVLGSGGR